MKNKVKNIKRICALLLIVILVTFGLASCSSGNNTNESASNTSSASSESASNEAENAESTDTEPFKIVTTIFPEYDWTREILGDNPANAELIMLLDKGVDLHNFQPTAQDIMNISTCDLFVYIGGESDGWVADALKEAVNPDMVVINILESLGELAKEEELVEGMEEDHEHEEETHEEDEEHADEENHEEGEDHEHEGELDEHVWLSLRNAIELTNTIADAIKQIDPTNAEIYTANTEAYIQKLTALDSEYQAAIATKERNTILFGDRFPFRYLVDDYDINYYAAFSGCSAETEASFETVTFLANKVDELKLPYVMTIEGTDHRIAETIISNTTDKNQEVLTIDSMQSTTSEAIANGTTYLSLMEKNLEVLKQALGTK